MPSEHFVKLPTAVLNDPALSLECIAVYSVLVDAADRENRQNVRISIRRLGERIRRSTDTARRLLHELIENGYVEVAKSPAGRCFTYRLTPSIHASGLDRRPLAPGPSTPSGRAGGTPSTAAPQRRRTLDGPFVNGRTYGKEKADPSDEMLEALFDLEWPAEKIRRETSGIYRQIGGTENEHAFLAELRRVRTLDGIKDPFRYALEVFRRQHGI